MATSEETAIGIAHPTTVPANFEPEYSDALPARDDADGRPATDSREQ